jgi:hypothetical protein
VALIVLVAIASGEVPLAEQAALADSAGAGAVEGSGGGDKISILNLLLIPKQRKNSVNPAK